MENGFSPESGNHPDWYFCGERSTENPFLDKEEKFKIFEATLRTLKNFDEINCCVLDTK